LINHDGTKMSGIVLAERHVEASGRSEGPAALPRGKTPRFSKPQWALQVAPVGVLSPNSPLSSLYPNHWTGCAFFGL